MKKVKRKIGEEEVEYDVWERSETGDCPSFDAKDLIVKVCPRKECKMNGKTYPLSEETCCMPECRYKKDNKEGMKGELRKLKTKISNKEICQLNRGAFKIND